MKCWLHQCLTLPNRSHCCSNGAALRCFGWPRLQQSRLKPDSDNQLLDSASQRHHVPSGVSDSSIGSRRTTRPARFQRSRCDGAAASNHVCEMIIALQCFHQFSFAMSKLAGKRVNLFWVTGSQIVVLQPSIDEFYFDHSPISPFYCSAATAPETPRSARVSNDAQARSNVVIPTTPTPLTPPNPHSSSNAALPPSYDASEMQFVQCSTCHLSNMNCGLYTSSIITQIIFRR